MDVCWCGHRKNDHVNCPSLPKPCMECGCEAYVRYQAAI
jgi:hypothetical protein